MSFPETFCIQEVLLTDLNNGAKITYIEIVIFPVVKIIKAFRYNLQFIFYRICPSPSERYYYSPVCSRMKWAIGCLISVILEGNSRNLKGLNSLGRRGVWRKNACCILDPCSFFLCSFPGSGHLPDFLTSSDSINRPL